MPTLTGTVAFQDANEDHFRYVLGHFASGVVAVTGADTDGSPLGLAVSSFTSVSLRPPLVSFCAAHTSRTWPRLRTSPGICLNILSEDQQDSCTRLARSGEEKFNGLSWSPSPMGLPVLDGALAWMEGRLSAEYLAGDHSIVVVSVGQLAATGRFDPLISYRGGYSRLTSR